MKGTISFDFYALIMLLSFDQALKFLLILCHFSHFQGYITLDRSCYAISHSDQYTHSTSTVSSDGGELTVNCQCRVEESSVFIATGRNIRVDCVLQMLRCPLQQRLEVVFNKN